MTPPDQAVAELDRPPLIRPAISELQDSKIVEVWKLGFTVPDVIGLWVGEGDLPTPAFINDAAIASLQAGETFYTPKRGIPELHAALIDYHRDLYGIRLGDERIAVTSAGMNAMMLVMQAIISPGDNVIVVTPVWPNLAATIGIMNGEVRELALDSTPAGWQLDLDRLFAACDRRTRAVYIASPGNPTGWVMPPEQQQAVLEFCRRRGIWVIADEVYARLIYDRKVAPSFLSLASPEDRLFAVNSFSKTWAMTGWRVGWLIMPTGLAAIFDKLMEYNTSGGQTFLQRGGVAAVEEGEPFVAEQIARYRAGRDLVVQRLGSMRRVRVSPCEAAFYLMFQVDGEPDSYALAMKLVDRAQVGLAPGIAFGTGGEGYLRLCFAASPGRLSQAMDRLEPFFT